MSDSPGLAAQNFSLADFLPVLSGALGGLDGEQGTRRPRARRGFGARLAVARRVVSVGRRVSGERNSLLPAVIIRLALIGPDCPSAFLSLCQLIHSAAAKDAKIPSRYDGHVAERHLCRESITRLF
jgi:hypothetical protein